MKFFTKLMLVGFGFGLSNYAIAADNCVKSIHAKMPIKPMWINPNAESQDYVIMWDQTGQELGSFTDNNGDGYADIDFTYTTCGGNPDLKKLDHDVYHVEFQRRIFQPYNGAINGSEPYGNWNAYVWTHTAGGHRGSRVSREVRVGWDDLGTVWPNDYLSYAPTLVHNHIWYWQINWWQMRDFAGETYCPQRTDSNPDVVKTCGDVTFNAMQILYQYAPNPTPNPADSCKNYAASYEGRGFYWNNFRYGYTKLGDSTYSCNGNTSPFARWPDNTATTSGLRFLCIMDRVNINGYWVDHSMWICLGPQ